MKESLVIDLANLPEEGEYFEGELDPKLFKLPTRDAQPAGPLYYDLHAQRFEDELLVRGYISSPFTFTCVRDNKQFTKTICIEEFGESYEINEASMNLTEALREEVLIRFPDYPNCSHSDDPQDCEVEERYLAVDKDPESGVDEASQSTGDDHWSALDDLDQFKD